MRHFKIMGIQDYNFFRHEHDKPKRLPYFQGYASINWNPSPQAPWEVPGKQCQGIAIKQITFSTGPSNLLYDGAGNASYFCKQTGARAGEITLILINISKTGFQCCFCVAFIVFLIGGCCCLVFQMPSVPSKLVFNPGKGVELTYSGWAFEALKWLGGGGGALCEICNIGANEKGKVVLYIAPFWCNMLKGTLQWSVYRQQAGSIYRRKWQLLQISPCMLVLILPTLEGWKAEWTLAGKKVTQIFNPRPGWESNWGPQDWEAEILTPAPTPLHLILGTIIVWVNMYILRCLWVVT